MWQKCCERAASARCPWASSSPLPLAHAQSLGPSVPSANMRLILGLPCGYFITIFFLFWLFQAIQERLQAWVNQRSCFLLVNRSNSLEKRILGKKTMQMMLFQIFLILSLIKKTTQLKPYLLLYRSVTNLLTQNNYAFKIRTCLLVVILKWFLILWLYCWRFMWMN